MERFIELAKKIKRAIKVAAGKQLKVTIDAETQTTKLGSGYGEWTLITSRLNEKSTVYSFGVGEEAAFDIGLIELIGCKIFAFDPTPKSLDWVKSNISNPDFIMHPFGLSHTDGQMKMYLPKNLDHVSGSILNKQSHLKNEIQANFKRLKTIMNELQHEQIDVLKMDIEGAEYKVIDDIIACGINPGQILIEFHHRFGGIGIRETELAVNKIRNHGYLLYHVSETLEEFSFMHNRLLGEC